MLLLLLLLLLLLWLLSLSFVIVVVVAVIIPSANLTTSKEKGTTFVVEQNPKYSTPYPDAGVIKFQDGRFDTNTTTSSRDKY